MEVTIIELLDFIELLELARIEEESEGVEND